MTAARPVAENHGMYDGSRVTDAVEYWKRRGELKGALKVVRSRRPERLRWKRAVGLVSQSVGGLRGDERARIEEPVRELLLDLGDDVLRREVVLEGRACGVDYDRGEILPHRSLADVQRLAFLAGTDLSRLALQVRLPSDREAAVDTAAVVVMGRRIGELHRARSQHLLLQIPDDESGEPLRLHHRIMLQRASSERADAERWLAFAKAVLATDA